VDGEESLTIHLNLIIPSLNPHGRRQEATTAHWVFLLLTSLSFSLSSHQPHLTLSIFLCCYFATSRFDGIHCPLARHCLSFSVFHFRCRSNSIPVPRFAFPSPPPHLFFRVLLFRRGRFISHNIRITWIRNRQSRNSKIFSTSCTQIDIVSSIMMNSSFC